MYYYYGCHAVLLNAADLVASRNLRAGKDYYSGLEDGGQFPHTYPVFPLTYDGGFSTRMRVNEGELSGSPTLLAPLTYKQVVPHTTLLRLARCAFLVRFRLTNQAGSATVVDIECDGQLISEASDQRRLLHFHVPILPTSSKRLDLLDRAERTAAEQLLDAERCFFC
jgi:hypothetical protein